MIAIPTATIAGFGSLHLNVGDAFPVEYAIGCETATRTLWDNNFAANYRLVAND